LPYTMPIRIARAKERGKEGLPPQVHMEEPTDAKFEVRQKEKARVRDHAAIWAKQYTARASVVSHNFKFQSDRGSNAVKKGIKSQCVQRGRQEPTVWRPLPSPTRCAWAMRCQCKTNILRCLRTRRRISKRRPLH